MKKLLVSVLLVNMLAVLGACFEVSANDLIGGFFVKTLADNTTIIGGDDILVLSELDGSLPIRIGDSIQTMLPDTFMRLPISVTGIDYDGHGDNDEIAILLKRVDDVDDDVVVFIDQSGNRLGRFDLPSQIARRAQWITAVDFDKDGTTDQVAVFYYRADWIADSAITYFDVDGTVAGSLNPVGDFASNNGIPAGIAGVDYDADGKDDELAVFYFRADWVPGSVVVYRELDGTFIARPGDELGNFGVRRPAGIAGVDFNGDGKNNELALLLYRPDWIIDSVIQYRDASSASVLGVLDNLGRLWDGIRRDVAGIFSVDVPDCDGDGIGDAVEVGISGTLVATPPILWPVNHKMVNIALSGITSSNGAVTLTVDSVTSNEAINGLGDGNTEPDALLSPLQLRAERSGKGSGRVYTISVTATDCAGTANRSVNVTVPHDQR